MKSPLASILLVSAFQSVALAQPLLVCGNAGSVRDRIENCRQVNKEAAHKLEWQLVRVDEQLREVWLDTRTRLIWGPRLEGRFDYFSGLMNCANSDVFYLNRVPSVDEYEMATLHEMQSVLPDVRIPETPQDFYWTATVNRSEQPTPASAYFYWASASTPGKSTFQPMALGEPAFLRCVGTYPGFRLN